MFPQEPCVLLDVDTAIARYGKGKVKLHTSQEDPYGRSLSRFL